MKKKTKRNPADLTTRNSASYRRRIGQLEMDYKKLEFMLEIQDKQIEVLVDHFRRIEAKKILGKKK